MSPRAQIPAIAALITWLTFLAIAGSSRMSGPVIWVITETHGVHLDDLFVLAAWALCMAWCWAQWRRAPRK